MLGTQQQGGKPHPLAQAAGLAVMALTAGLAVQDTDPGLRCGTQVQVTDPGH